MRHKTINGLDRTKTPLSNTNLATGTPRTLTETNARSNSPINYAFQEKANRRRMYKPVIRAVLPTSFPGPKCCGTPEGINSEVEESLPEAKLR